MSININPISYQSRTKNGNEYRKTDLCKTISLVTAVGVGIATRKKQKKSIGASFS